MHRPCNHTHTLPLRAQQGLARFRAALKGQQKCWQYRRQGSTAYVYMPFTLETHDRPASWANYFCGCLEIWELRQARVTRALVVSSSLRNGSFATCHAREGRGRVVVKASAIAIKHALTWPMPDVANSDLLVVACLVGYVLPVCALASARGLPLYYMCPSHTFPVADVGSTVGMFYVTSRACFAWCWGCLPFLWLCVC
jgi:hypothetical protein